METKQKTEKSFSMDMNEGIGN